MIKPLEPWERPQCSLGMRNWLQREFERGDEENIHACRCRDWDSVVQNSVLSDISIYMQISQAFSSIDIFRSIYPKVYVICFGNNMIIFRLCFCIDASLGDSLQLELLLKPLLTPALLPVGYSTMPVAMDQDPGGLGPVNAILTWAFEEMDSSSTQHQADGRPAKFRACSLSSVTQYISYSQWWRNRIWIC
jgi:hypothetical protein